MSMYDFDRDLVTRQVLKLRDKLMETDNGNMSRESRVMDMISVIGALGASVEAKDRGSQKDLCCKLAALAMDYAIKT